MAALVLLVVIAVGALGWVFGSALDKVSDRRWKRWDRRR